MKCLSIIYGLKAKSLMTSCVCSQFKNLQEVSDHVSKEFSKDGFLNALQRIKCCSSL